MRRKKVLKLTEEDKDFVKNLSQKLILRAYLTNSANRSRTLEDKIKTDVRQEAAQGAGT